MVIAIWVDSRCGADGRLVGNMSPRKRLCHGCCFTPMSRRGGSSTDLDRDGARWNKSFPATGEAIGALNGGWPSETAIATPSPGRDRRAGVIPVVAAGDWRTPASRFVRKLCDQRCFVASIENEFGSFPAHAA